MPGITIERPKMTRVMYQALKRHIMRDRERKKQEQEHDKAMERQRKEREQRKKKEEEDSLTLEQTKEQISALEKRLESLKGEKHELFSQLKKVLHQEDENRKRAQLKEHNEMMSQQYSTVQTAHPMYMQAHLQPRSNKYMSVPIPHQHVAGVKRSRSPTPPPPSNIYQHYPGGKYPATTSYTTQMKQDTYPSVAKSSNYPSTHVTYAGQSESQYQSPHLQQQAPPTQHQTPPSQHQAPPPRHQTPPSHQAGPSQLPAPPTQHQTPPSQQKPALQHQVPPPQHQAPPKQLQIPPPGNQAAPVQHQVPPPQHQAPPPRQVPLTGHQAPPTGHQAPPTGHQAPPTGHEAPSPGLQAPPPGHQAPPTGHPAPPPQPKVSTPQHQTPSVSHPGPPQHPPVSQSHPGVNPPQNKTNQSQGGKYPPGQSAFQTYSTHYAHKQMPDRLPQGYTVQRLPQPGYMDSPHTPSSLSLQQQLEHANQKSGFSEDKFKMQQPIRGVSAMPSQQQAQLLATSQLPSAQASNQQPPKGSIVTGYPIRTQANTNFQPPSTQTPHSPHSTGPRLSYRGTQPRPRYYHQPI